MIRRSDPTDRLAGTDPRAVEALEIARAIAGYAKPPIIRQHAVFVGLKRIEAILVAITVNPASCGHDSEAQP